MKKVLAITSLLVAVASSSYATEISSGGFSTAAAKVYGGVDDTAAQNAPTPLIKFSTGVNGQIYFTTTGGTSYLIGTKHGTGSKIFGTCNSVNNIYWKQSVDGPLSTTVSMGFSDTNPSNFVGGGWTSY